MILIAGLGNPGSKYRKNRHNAGFIIVDGLASNTDFSLSKKFNAEVCKIQFADTEAVLIKPHTFMNNSGESINAAIKFYNIEPSSLIVIHDEIELNFNTVKHKFGGGHKGHNGLRSIIQCLGTSDYHRIRIGVGRPPDINISVADYVLSDFTREEYEKISEIALLSHEIIASIIKKN